MISAFAESYASGETPIPCVACNQNVKFLDLLETARDLGADALATGHYVERRDGAGGPMLYRGADPARDQSYFLFATTKEQLAQLMFPLGAEVKGDVRQIAQEMGLPVAAKPDSQDICFVPTGRYASVVEKLRPDAAEPGDIVHVDGRKLGRHQGIIHYTIGQRRGLGVAEGAPLFVVALDPGKRHVIVGPREALLTKRLALRDVNWLGDGDLADLAGRGLDVHVRVRSSQAPQPARLVVDGEGSVSVELVDGEHGVAKGQACVFYDGGEARARVLGGGFIGAALNAFDSGSATRAVAAAQ